MGIAGDRGNATYHIFIYAMYQDKNYSSPHIASQGRIKKPTSDGS